MLIDHSTEPRIFALSTLQSFLLFRLHIFRRLSMRLLRRLLFTFHHVAITNAYLQAADIIKNDNFGLFPQGCGFKSSFQHQGPVFSNHSGTTSSPVTAQTPSNFPQLLTASILASLQAGSPTPFVSGAALDQLPSTSAHAALKSNAVLNAASIFLNMNSSSSLSSTSTRSHSGQVVSAPSEIQVESAIDRKSKSSTISTFNSINSHSSLAAAAGFLHEKESPTKLEQLHARAPTIKHHHASTISVPNLKPRQHARTTKSRVHFAKNPHTHKQEKVTTRTTTTTIVVTVTVTAGQLGYIN